MFRVAPDFTPIATAMNPHTQSMIASTITSSATCVALSRPIIVRSDMVMIRGVPLFRTSERVLIVCTFTPEK